MSLKKKDKSKHLSHTEVSMFFRELSLLFESGVSLGEALFIMSDNSDSNQKKDMCRSIAEAIDDGSTLFGAMSSCGRFPPHALQMTEIGQTSGKLESVFTGLADYYERQESLQRTIKSVLTYPLIMIAVMFCVLSVLIIKVLPLFGAVFKETGAQMPLILRMVTESNVFSGILIALLLVVLALVAVVFAGAGKGLTSGQGSGGVFSRLPFMKGIMRETEAGNFAYSMALLLSGGVTLDVAVDMAEEMTGSAWAREKIGIVKNHMELGETFSASIIKANFLQGTFSALLAAGEKAGRTDTMMDLIANKYTDRISSKINSVLAVIEPTLVIIMSLVIGGILLSIMVPLMNILTSV